MPQTILERMQAPGPKKILACDGGGILGWISVETLARLEYQLRVSLGRDDKFVLADYFDFVCGTGTGAIIAACIASGMSMDKIRQLYLDCGKPMFDKASLLKRLNYSYNDEPLAKLLKKAFNEQLLESNPTLGSPKLRTLLMLMLRQHSTDSPWPVTNNPLAKYNDFSRRDCNLFLPLWQLARASCAAPTYFPPELVTFAEGTPEEHRFIFGDGGLTPYNNPAFLAFQMVTAQPYHILWPTGEDKLLIVSVGPGVADMNSCAGQNQPSALINATSAGWDMACRTLGACRHGAVIDKEIGGMPQIPGKSNFSGPKLFSYLRYDPTVTREHLDALGLQNIAPAHVQTPDSIDYIDDIRRVGIEYAKRHIKPDHFKDFV